MSRIAYVNGRYLDMRDASVNIEDRGYQFADGVYEVCEVRGGKLIDMPRHLARLQRSLGELRIKEPMPLAALSVVMHEVVRRNRVSHGIVYLQVTRGVARRDHGFPAAPVKPAVVVTARSLDPAKGQANAAHGIKVITLPENRWPRVDIKSTALLPNVLAKQVAREAGAYEAWYVDRDGYVTEGSSSNAWIVTKEGRVVTRSADAGILAGVTRAVLMDAFEALQVRFEERPFTPAEAAGAAEAFVTASSQIVMPVVAIDGQPIGDGKPGALAKRLREQFHRFAVFS
ncbi:D-alanine aminotransferase [Rhodopseudomonas palustris]|uniref:Probable branched-chain-amino-acid aminotransferase n=1 Tax=Rhodopseudomonas palustris (strain ATCC BAA-98 / CGA009) TaxID=258594 RepID=Q6N6L9_RHOPA|nr:D-amino-acid transaminase [Rhodopseudomonas palustris]OPF90169.1 D-amino-acid transaminase [Rhodopseudomonas palustris]QQM04117.1 D-alanine aminotransferase [Rhodopseudomonas palustris]RJF62166.1 D-amino-acid transaminase [Rhodopseudomonas palustris]WAB75511.1 D-amino-acid transaminase [Rhodopseudomonas palustris]WCL92756.1 D-amino-acid transaminase [Rhodopseudomonas palustris CGA009]